MPALTRSSPRPSSGCICSRSAWSRWQAPWSWHLLPIIAKPAPREVSAPFLPLASRLLLGAMILLLLGLGIDFYVIAHVILTNRWLSVLLTLVLVSVFVYVWFLLPRLGR
jgi:hypothetical protein